jgi:Ca2+-binding EF-hand superfamily protein
MISGIGNAAQLSSKFFSALDTKSQGYLEKSDFVSAFSKISGDSSDTSSIDEIFSALDSDSDGKVTQSEFTSTLSKLQEELDSQFNQMRMQGGGGNGGPQGMGGRPPPPPASDDGFTKDELSSQLEAIGSSNSQQSSMISNIINNFDAADSNSDGEVSFTEANAYDKASQSSQGSSSSVSATDNSEAKIMMKIMQLMHAYGSANEDQTNNTLSGLLSARA